MRTTSFLFAFMMAAGPAARADEPGRIMSGTVRSQSDNGGFVVHYITRAEPPHAGLFSKLGAGGVTTSGPGKVHRFMCDDTNQVYFGYDLSVEPVPGTTRSRVTFEPLSLTADQLHSHFKPVGSGFRSVLIPRYPPPQVIENGDTIALDLLVSPDGQQKVVDYLQISSTTATKTTIVTSTKDDSESRDFSVSDVELHITDPSVRMNGQRMAGIPMGESTGQILWLHIPGHGRFLLALTPQPGYDFQRAGTVHHTTIRFQAGGDEYELQTSAPVLALGKRFNLYVLHDPGYNPAQAKSSIAFGAAARVQDVLSARVP